MRIWKKPISVATLTAMSENTASSHLGLEFVEVGDDFIRARVPVDARTKQPGSNEGIIVTDPNNNVVLVNPAAKRRLLTVTTDSFWEAQFQTFLAVQQLTHRDSHRPRRSCWVIND